MNRNGRDDTGVNYVSASLEIGRKELSATSDNSMQCECYASSADKGMTVRSDKAHVRLACKPHFPYFRPTIHTSHMCNVHQSCGEQRKDDEFVFCCCILHVSCRIRRDEEEEGERKGKSI